MSDYKKTLCLPETSFPMKANLKQREPETLNLWEEIDVLALMVKANEGNERYTLHDGPPYANGHIHMGTAMNKVLKDIIVKFKNMHGYRAEYVPGWDCHGLPIEHKVAQELKEKGKENLPAVTVRKICRDYATKFMKIQRDEFKRLGVFGTWSNPYLTMLPTYEAATARELGRFMANGSVYRGKKPIHWCICCETALAEAEVEYADHASPSIYVRFPVDDAAFSQKFSVASGKKAYLVIWTTTPWTIPSNMAVAVHPEYEYVLALVQGEVHVVASERLAALQKKFKWQDVEVLAVVTGKDLEGIKARHPFIDRVSPVVLADYVTLDTGTGLVHTAPGHGREDYETGLRYGLEVLSPLDDKGRFLPVVNELAGKTVIEANPEVIRILRERGALLAEEKLSHSYPHCWRCKQPVIFRATTQWFISMEKNDLRAKALRAIEKDVRWIPAWGRERIHAMIEHRPDWCISRQRTWGVPIIALICKDCDTAYTNSEWVFSVVDQFEKHPTGCDYWFETPVEKLAPAGLKCPHCGGGAWEKEDDILDVWFDSGTSFAAVLEQRPECTFPADLYLEGTDQHRGWFHSSLLASIGTRARPPYKSVLTHGYVVDGDGRKMSKSLGNVVAPQEIIDKYGAEVLRLWVSAVNYQEDVRISSEILDRLVDAYRRIRNTCRFILGNLSDFSPDKAVPFAEMGPVDRYALDLFRLNFEKVREAYQDFEFHKVFHTLHNLCVTDLSAFYLDVIKDRLYVSGKDSKERRAAQTVIWKTLLTLMQEMAPILCFTAEEVFRSLPEVLRPKGQTVFESRFTFDTEERLDAEERANLKLLPVLRAEVNKAAEPIRKSGTIGHSLDTHVTIYAPDSLLADLKVIGADLRELFIVSKVSLAAAEQAPADAYRSVETEGLAIKVEKASGVKCERCWVYDERTGEAGDFPGTCPRCARILTGVNC
ncbi:isoleucine--tRNA ligase [Desulfocurvibacter africanus]|uniref:isoleucine--tRNA ligase n=1 Tax=Desulfocurvibacter africanus TaxID=873 RepID=UPI0004210363|nr:isoleucine--tRNA ligase [Desulfocurvibacter africanus]